MEEKIIKFESELFGEIIVIIDDELENKKGGKFVEQKLAQANESLSKVTEWPW
jgi:hypothetical protein